MDPNLAVFLALFVVVLAGLVLGARYVVPIVAQHFKGASGGWNRLSRVYASRRHLPAQVRRRQNVVVGQVVYRWCVDVGADDKGLCLERGFPFSIFGRRPLFIPWSDFKRIEEARLFWRQAVLLSIGEPLVGTITVPIGLFNDLIRPMLGKAAGPLGEGAR